MVNIIGKKGEDLAIEYLKHKGFTLRERNYRTRWGEIDIIAEKNNTIYFIEVKTRQNLTFGKPYEAVNYFKVEALKKAITFYIRKKKVKDKKFSLSVISIILSSELTKRVIKFYNFIGFSNNLYGNSY